jgi:hypothetical protein
MGWGGDLPDLEQSSEILLSPIHGVGYPHPGRNRAG